MAQTATSEKFKIREVRLSFPHLWTPKVFKNDDDENQDDRYRWEAAFLIDPTTEQGEKNIKLIVKLANEVAKEQWPDGMPAGVVPCFGYANGEDPVVVYGKKLRIKEQGYEGYEGMFSISSHIDRQPPAVVDLSRRRLEEKDGKPYAGCIVHASLSLWCQDNKWGKRINCNLRGVQFVRDGEMFGTAPIDADEEFDVEDPDDEFDDEGGEEEDDPLA